jgi:hypothetical protein
MVMDYRTLRTVIGGIAVFLVPVVFIGNWVLFSRHVSACLWPFNPRIPDSLSGFYYTHMRNLFAGAMCAMGVFFAAYRGRGRWDNRLTNVAGVAAVCIALFPTMPPSFRLSTKGPNQFFLPSNMCGPVTPITYHQSSHQSLFGRVHESSLIVLFLMVFLMVLVQFTRTNEPAGQAQTGERQRQERSADRGNHARGIRAWWNSLFTAPRPEKRHRNAVYVICAGGIAISGLLALITIIRPWPLLQIAELGAFLSFGVAWYVKGAASAPRRTTSRCWSRRFHGPIWHLADDPHSNTADGSNL